MNAPYLTAVFALHPLGVDLQVELAHSRRNCFLVFIVEPHAVCGVLLRESRKQVEVL
jgi:hypothetical protein